MIGESGGDALGRKVGQDDRFRVARKGVVDRVERTVRANRFVGLPDPYWSSGMFLPSSGVRVRVTPEKIS